MSAEPITDLATAVEALGALPMPAGPAPQPAHRWQQLRTELIHAFSPYMPSVAVSKATDAVDELIRELGAPGLTPRGGAEAGR